MSGLDGFTGLSEIWWQFNNILSAMQLRIGSVRSLGEPRTATQREADVCGHVRWGMALAVGPVQSCL